MTSDDTPPLPIPSMWERDPALPESPPRTTLRSGARVRVVGGSYPPTVTLPRGTSIRVQPEGTKGWFEIQHDDILRVVEYDGREASADGIVHDDLLREIIFPEDPE